ncbi:MAG: glycosyltransferase family 2 protein [Desulfatitalea sp.]|nr:glycosyltransferase family 2 protein [Desulfatitalea sp.]NNK01104.1 glycosyltransferase family 2 protein [Desulfatitalea sp.]
MSTLRSKSSRSRTLPHVSVVLPTYNRATMVTRAIDSVLEQSYPHFELIVVDDGSTDSTAERLRGYGARITVITTENNGVSAARNHGILASRGEWLALIDSDDTWLPEKLATQVAYFMAHPQMMICQTEEIWIRNGQRVNPKQRHQKQAGMIFEKSLPLCLVSPSAVMIQRHLLEEVGLFDETLPACEDYDLWLRITWQYPVGLIDTPLIIKHGGHADQLSCMPELDKYRIAAILKVLGQPLLTQPQRGAALDMLRHKCRIYAQGCLKRGKASEARRYMALPDQFT